jgi:hypothetical protein
VKAHIHESHSFGNPRGQVLRTRILVDDGVPHSGEAALRQTFPRTQQPTPVGPLRIELAAPVVAQFPGDAAAHLGQRVVAELDEVKVIDHDLRVG